MIYIIAYKQPKGDVLASHILPCKSHTDIDKDNKAFAKYQYGNSPVEI